MPFNRHHATRIVNEQLSHLTESMFDVSGDRIAVGGKALRQFRRFVQQIQYGASGIGREALEIEDDWRSLSWNFLRIDDGAIDRQSTEREIFHQVAHRLTIRNGDRPEWINISFIKWTSSHPSAVLENFRTTNRCKARLPWSRISRFTAQEGRHCCQ